MPCIRLQVLELDMYPSGKLWHGKEEGTKIANHFQINQKLFDSLSAHEWY